MVEGARVLKVGVATLAAAVALLLAAGAPAEAAVPEIHAHRGGTLKTIKGKQVPVRPEETLATFRRAARLGFVLELDVKLTSDGVPVVIHDASLERTTDCDQNVSDLSARKLRRSCEVDLLGTTDNERPMKRGDKRRAPVPTLRQVLKMANKRRASINLEIKNFPGEPDYDPAPMPAYAKTIAAQIKKSKFPAKRLIVQSFWQTNLDVIEADPYFRRAQTSLLSLAVLNDSAPEAAASNGYDIVSPAWPISADYVQRSHRLGLGVVPYTVDDAAQLRAAGKAGVDAVITNDPLLARKVLCRGPGSRRSGTC